MKERPILFNSEMVRAVLGGRKTQTRRVIKQQPDPLLSCVCPPCQSGPGEVFPDQWSIGGNCGAGWMESPLGHCPYGEPGDQLWVRETWQKSGLGWGNNLRAGKLHYRATDNGEWKDYWGGWKPSIFMPRWASRILLEVKSVRVERVQDISNQDAVAEGIAIPSQIPTLGPSEGFPAGTPDWEPRFDFADLWDSINSKRGFGWESNPWVWVVEFDVVQKGGA